MIHFFTGTKAQFIKMAPVLVELRRRGVPCRDVDSGQHIRLTTGIRRSFGLPEPDVRLRADGDDIASMGAAGTWFFRTACRAVTGRRALRREVFPGGGICLIHGDTLSTLLGLWLARGAGLEVAHVEAGLRSFRRWDPFPEELIRVHCTKRADVLFPTNRQAAEQLDRIGGRGRIAPLSGNTVIDALRLARGLPVSVPVPDGPFALATCHRVETLMSRVRLRRVVELVNRVAEMMPVVFVMHQPTRSALERTGLAGTLAPSVTRLGLLDYPDFRAMLYGARLVLSDGGSIQEECACIGKPLLVLRSVTERPDGLGENAALWGFDDEVASRFLDGAMNGALLEPEERASPSAEIADALVEMGYGTES